MLKKLLLLIILVILFLIIIQYKAFAQTNNVNITAKVVNNKPTLQVVEATSSIVNGVIMLQPALNIN